MVILTNSSAPTQPGQASFGLANDGSTYNGSLTALRIEERSKD